MVPITVPHPASATTHNSHALSSSLLLLYIIRSEDPLDSSQIISVTGGLIKGLTPSKQCIFKLKVFLAPSDKVHVSWLANQ